MLDQYKEIRKVLLEKIEALRVYCSQKGNGKAESLNALCSKLGSREFLRGFCKKLTLKPHPSEAACQVLQP